MSEREILIRPAFHRCHPDAAKNYGIKDPDLWFILREDGWAMSWRLFSGWGMPLDAFNAESPDCSHSAHQAGFPSSGPTAGAVSWHAPVPLVDDRAGPCEWLGGECFGDQGFLLGDQAFDRLRTDGSDALFAFLSVLLHERKDQLASAVEP